MKDFSVREVSARKHGSGGGSRRLLHFFSWCRSRSRKRLVDDVFNHTIRAFVEMKDLTAMGIDISDLQGEGRRMRVVVVRWCGGGGAMATYGG